MNLFHARALHVTGILLALIPVCSGQTVKDLANFSLEELLNVNVTSAARKPQSLRTTAAAAFVITSEDIRRSGLRLLPELLRLAPGVQVARLDAGNWAISIRGFSSDYSSKLLVLVDGRSIYNEQHGGVFWDSEQMAVEDIERIEVIRGPGAAMWGTNAVHGVINILTKSSADTLGGLVTGEAGTAGTPTGVARYGGRVGSKATYRATGYFTGQRRLAPPPAAPSFFPSLQPNSGFNARSLSFRADWTPTAGDTVFVTGQAYNAADGRVFFDSTVRDPFPTVTYGEETSHQGQLTAGWQRVFSEKSSINVGFSFDHRDHNELDVPLDFNVQELSFAHHWSPLPRHELVWGATYRNANYHVTPSRTSHLPQPDWKLDVYAAFVADEITLVRDRLQLIAGVHAGHNALTGMEYQPTGRLVWTPTSNLTTWAAVSRAVRTPSIIERGDYTATVILGLAPVPLAIRRIGNPAYRSEPMVSYEVGQRVKIGNRISLDGAAFLNSYQREGGFTFTGPEFVPPQNGDPAYLEFQNIFQNSRYGQAFGAEVSAVWSATRRWKLNGGYSWLRQRMHVRPGYTGYELGQDPRQQFQIRSQLDLTHNFELDTAAYFYGSTLPLGGTAANGRYLRGDARLAWRPTENGEFTVGVRNALDPQHPESTSFRLNQLYQVRRNVYGSFSWHF